MVLEGLSERTPGSHRLTMRLFLKQPKTRCTGASGPWYVGVQRLEARLLLELHGRPT